ncbi:hypothetical protein O6H91_18G077300 [Diphasiastrum complanatum]|uniref:Uncharacterized protein n=1 Tax=Diphasiastrum complanatum TaxID=34168 RepID=A0ACC2B2Y9_DIPCM|nr:hypothetical protein O6H91_18G077300 [Diphasiastrum complanatum]
MDRPTLTLLYPLYASVRAIESTRKDDDHQWLSYWIIYSFLTLFELGAEPILKWIPFWPLAKLVFACWLVLPQFHGAAFVYERCLQPRVIRHLFCNEGNLADRQNKAAMQTAKNKPPTKRQATFKRTAKVRKRTTRKILEFFGMDNVSS